MHIEDLIFGQIGNDSVDYSASKPWNPLGISHIPTCRKWEKLSTGDLSNVLMRRIDPFFSVFYAEKRLEFCGE